MLFRMFYWDLNLTICNEIYSSSNSTDDYLFIIQGQVRLLTVENQALRVGQGAPDVVREKAKYASQQLASAAKTAEGRLKLVISAFFIV